MTKTLTINPNSVTLTFQVPFPAPDGLQWAPCLRATIAGAAEVAGVTARTVSNWLADPANPLPAVRRDGQGPLIDLAAMAMWLALRRRDSPDFGKHGGFR